MDLGEGLHMGMIFLCVWDVCGSQVWVLCGAVWSHGCEGLLGAGLGEQGGGSA